MIELTFLKELMLAKEMNQKSVIFVTIGIFEIKVLSFKRMFATVVNDLLAMSINLNDIAILDINGVDYRCIISGITKSKALNLLQNADLNERSGTL